MRYFWFVVLFFLTTSNLFAEKKARLQFVPNLPVQLTSDLGLDIQQSLPGLSLTTKGHQHLTGSVSIFADAADLVLTQPPFDLKFILASLKIDLKVNDENISFDSNEIGASLYLNQVSRLIDRPIMLRLKQGMIIEWKNQDFSLLMRELPVLQEINPQSLLSELFFHQFSLGGEELVVGKTFLKDLGEQVIPTLPSRFEYTITDIDDYHIHADIVGNIEKKSFQLEGMVEMDEDHQGSISGSLTGTVGGRIKWNRDNAMLYDVVLDYQYVATFSLGDWKWMMNMKLQAHHFTKLQK